MSALNHLLTTLKVEANVFHNGQYCGMWAIDTSGTKQMTFHVVSYGSCYLKVDEEILVLTAGDAVFFPSDYRHRVSNLATEDLPVNESISLPLNGDPKDDGTGLVCGHFGHHNPVFEKLLNQLPNSIIIRKEDQTASSDIIKLILKESIQADESTNMLLNRLSDCLFYLLLRDHVDTQSGLFSALAHPKLAKAMDLIHVATDRPLSVESLAAEAGMSRSGFSALFKEMVDQTPMEYITQWRMTSAYRWLADEGISTFEAALRCGYESEASFSKAFKRVMNIGPGEARVQFKHTAA